MVPTLQDVRKARQTELREVAQQVDGKAQRNGTEVAQVRVIGTRLVVTVRSAQTNET